jgi:hypothetical protein
MLYTFILANFTPLGQVLWRILLELLRFLIFFLGKKGVAGEKRRWEMGYLTMF